MIVAITIISLLYLSIIIWIIIGLRRLKSFIPIQIENTSKTKFSIIIPFRNEEIRLPLLIQSLQKLSYDYAFFELLLIDDQSNDQSVSIIEDLLQKSELDFRVLDNIRYSNSPKKDAISLAIKKAKYPWVVSTDADCIVSKDWLKILDAFIQKCSPKMVCLPVAFEKDTSLVKQFQFFDGLSLQAVTMAGFGNKQPLLCNGANLAYSKALFEELNGYEGNNQYASGDDIFLMEKVRRKYPDKIKFLGSIKTLVTTQSEDNLSEVIQQRIRWASKTKHTNNLFTKILGIVTVIVNMAFALGIFSYFLFPLDFMCFLIFMSFKILLDSLVLSRSACFFKERLNPFMVFLAQLLYPIVLIRVITGSIFGTYKWKGRAFQK